MPNDNPDHSSSDFPVDARTARAIIIEYLQGQTTQNLCDDYGLSASEIDVVLHGVERRSATDPTLEDMVNMYTLLYAAQLEIESLRREVSDLQRRLRELGGDL